MIWILLCKFALAIQQDPPACMRPYSFPEALYQPAITSNSWWGECNASDFAQEKELGQGINGKVHLAKHVPTGAMVALKVLENKRNETSMFERFRNEECIQHYVSDYDAVPDYYCTMVEGNNILMVMEPVWGRGLDFLLKPRVKSRIKLDELMAKRVVATIIRFLEEMHRVGVMFYDIRAKNVMVTWEGQVRIIDFGLAKRHDSPLPVYRKNPTPPRFPPGHIPHVDDYLQPDKPVLDDWYDVGLLMHQLYTNNRDPFHMMLSEYKFKYRYEWGIDCPFNMDEDACDLMQRLMHPQVSERWGLTEETRAQFPLHPWLRAVDWDSIPTWQ